ncbi:MAG: hypothetical protein HDT30_12245 [Clostridiales bacterium]|nr:hypothetical protein [Clostridiales bacterium]
MDFAIITTPFTVSANLCCEKMMEFREILVGGTDYFKIAGKELKLEELYAYSLIGLGNETVTYEFYKNFFSEHQIDYELDMEVATSDLMLPLIQNNLGIGFVAEMLAIPLLQNKSLVRINLDTNVPKREIQMVWDKGRGKSRLADIFGKYLQTGTIKEIE